MSPEPRAGITSMRVQPQHFRCQSESVVNMCPVRRRWRVERDTSLFFMALFYTSTRRVAVGRDAGLFVALF